MTEKVLLFLPQLLSGLTSLQRAAVRPTTENQYLQALWQFHLWLMGASHTAVADQTLDPLICRYFETVVSEAGAPSIGSKLLAALLHILPERGRHIHLGFPLAHRALQGWQNGMPPKTRPPLPFAMLILIVTQLLAWNEIAMAICIWVGFHGYLRPREMSSLLRHQPLPPTTAAGPISRVWSLNLHPCEDLRPSKIGYYDECVLLDDLASTTWMQQYLTLLRARGGQVPLWPFKHVQLVQRRKLSTQAAAQIDSYFDDPNLARKALHQHVNIIGPG